MNLSYITSDDVVREIIAFSIVPPRVAEADTPVVALTRFSALLRNSLSEHFVEPKIAIDQKISLT